MDDVKLYEENKEELEATMQLTESVSEAIGMSLGVRKCGVVHMRAGRVRSVGGVESLRAGRVSEIGRGSSYKYLGVEQLIGRKDGMARKRVTEEYLRRTRKVWNSHLKMKSKVAVHNSRCVGALRYLGGVLNWRGGGVKLDVATRRILKACKAHHKGSAVERLYIPRKEGGRGLHSVQHVLERETVSAANYLAKSTDPRIQGVARLQRELEAMGETPLIARAKAVLRGYGVSEGDLEDASRKKLMSELGRRQKEKLCQIELEQKTLHGKVARMCATDEGVDVGATNGWLIEGKLDAETEMIVIAAQDEVTHTRWYNNRYVKRCQTECRVCGAGTETVFHILSACKGHLFGLIKERHDRILYLLVKAVMKSLQITVPWKMTGPGGVAVPGVWGTAAKRILVDQLIPTKREMRERKPDLVVRLRDKNYIAIFEVACPWATNVRDREMEKQRKYQELAADLATQYDGYRVHVFPVVIGNLGLIRGLRRHLETSQVMSNAEIHNFMGHAQREVLCSAVKIIKRHMTM